MAVEQIQQEKIEGSFFKKGDLVYIIPAGADTPNFTDWKVDGFEDIDGVEWVRLSTEDGDIDYYKEEALKALQGKLVEKKLQRRQ
jgi:hypothetical protein